MVLFNVFKLISIVCFASAANACRANIMVITVTKNEIAPVNNILIISSKEVTVLINVEAMIPAYSHDSITIDALTCRDDKWKQLVISNQNFYLQYKNSTDNHTVYRFISTQKLITPKDTSNEWQWLCELSTHWDGCQCDVVHNFMVKVHSQNKTNDSTCEIIPIDEHQGPAEPKQLTCRLKELKDMNRLRSTINNVDVNLSSQQANSAKNHLEPTEKTFSIRNHSEEGTEPKFRDHKGKNLIPTEKIDGTDRGMEPTNSFKDVNNSSSHVGCGEATTLTSWVIVLVASMVIFLVGLVIGIFCRHLRATKSEPKQTDNQMEENIYDEADTKGTNSRPPLPVPEQAIYIYNSPYDHTLRFQNI